MKKSFIIYYDQSKMFKELSDEQAGKLIKCLLSNGDMSDIGDGMVRVAYASLITTIERDNIKYTQRCEKNRENANIRWNTTEFDGMQLHANACERIPANAKHADSDSDSDSENESDKEKKKGFLLPDWLEPDLFKDFIEHRNKLRKPMTEKARALFISKLSGLVKKGYTPIELIETAIERGWLTVFEPTKSPGNRIQDQNIRAAISFITEGQNE